MNKTRKQHSKQPAQAQRAATKSRSPLVFHLGLVVAVVGFLLYANTLNHKYALDDYSLIIENTVTQKGVKAIPEIFKTGYRSGYNSIDVQLYRPTSKAMYAV